MQDADMMGRGGKTGSGRQSSESQVCHVRDKARSPDGDGHRRIRCDALNLPSAQDPYFMKNHLGTYECKLCLTIHTNEGVLACRTEGSSDISKETTWRTLKERGISRTLPEGWPRMLMSRGWGFNQPHPRSRSSSVVPGSRRDVLLAEDAEEVSEDWTTWLQVCPLSVCQELIRCCQSDEAAGS
eukprot:767509-Hanusia_phi.AAC.2